MSEPDFPISDICLRAFLLQRFDCVQFETIKRNQMVEVHKISDNNRKPEKSVSLVETCSKANFYADRNQFWDLIAIEGLGSTAF